MTTSGLGYRVFWGLRQMDVDKRLRIVGDFERTLYCKAALPRRAVQTLVGNCRMTSPARTTNASSNDMNETDFRILLQPSSTYISPVVTRSISCPPIAGRSSNPCDETVSFQCDQARGNHGRDDQQLWREHFRPTPSV